MAKGWSSAGASQITSPVARSRRYTVVPDEAYRASPSTGTEPMTEPPSARVQTSSPVATSTAWTAPGPVAEVGRCRRRSSGCWSPRRGRPGARPPASSPAVSAVSSEALGAQAAVGQVVAELGPPASRRVDGRLAPHRVTGAWCSATAVTDGPAERARSPVVAPSTPPRSSGPTATSCTKPRPSLDVPPGASEARLQPGTGAGRLRVPSAAGRRTTKRGAPPGACRRPRIDPPWAVDDGGRDRETRARAPPSRPPRASSRVREALEDAGPVTVGDAGAVVARRSARRCRRWRWTEKATRGARRGARRWWRGSRPAARGRCRGPTTCPPDTRRVSMWRLRRPLELAGLAQHELVEVDRWRCGGRGPSSAWASTRRSSTRSWS